jgi:rubrerythrin
VTDEQFQALAAIGLQQIALLEQSRDAVVVIEVEESDECQHPDEARVDMRTLSSRGEHWICSVCRYEHGVIQN